MGKIKDISGLKFGRLLVQEARPNPGKDKHILWMCLCDCGKTVVKRSFNLHSESACSFCYRPSQNMIGRKFGRLTVVAFHHKDRDIYWKTICKCGTEGLHATGPMKGGHVKSCGCFLKESRKRGLTGDQSALRKAIHQYTGNCTTTGRKWLLSEEEARQLLIANCVGCNAPPHRRIKTETATLMCNGIDRIDNSIDYTINNVQTLCKTCNFAKAELTQEEFKDYLDRIRANSPIKPFYLLRIEDIHGNSGTGVVAVGGILPSGRCVLEWIVGELTETIFESIEQIGRLHGHNGRTEVIMGAPPK